MVPGFNKTALTGKGYQQQEHDYEHTEYHFSLIGCSYSLQIQIVLRIIHASIVIQEITSTIINGLRLYLFYKSRKI